MFGKIAIYFYSLIKCNQNISLLREGLLKALQPSPPCSIGEMTRSGKAEGGKMNTINLVLRATRLLIVLLFVSAVFFPSAARPLDLESHFTVAKSGASHNWLSYRCSGGGDSSRVKAIDILKAFTCPAQDVIWTPSLSREESVPIKVGTQPSGLSFFVDGIEYNAPVTFDWIPGSKHSLSISLPQNVVNGRRYVWHGWSDGGEQDHTITVGRTSTAYTAAFKQQFFLTMEATGGTVATPSGFYDEGTFVEIRAGDQASGCFFDRWEGSGNGAYSGTLDPAIIVMNGPITENGITLCPPPPTPLPTSTPPQGSITVETVPTGLTFWLNGTPYTAPRRFTFTSGTVVSLTAISPQGGNDTRHVWTSWSDGGAQTHSVTTPLTENSTYTAYFKKQYLLTTMATGGTVAPGTGYYDENQLVQVSSVPNYPWWNLHWEATGSGSYTGSNNPATVVMNAPITENAIWVGRPPSGTPTQTPTLTPTPTPKTISVTIASDPPGRTLVVDGVTYTSSQNFDWIAGTEHTLFTPALQHVDGPTRYVWVNWSDGGDPIHTVAPTSSTTITANFKTQHYLETCCTNSGFSAGPTGFFDAGTVVGIGAFSNNDLYFRSWSGSGSGSYSGPIHAASVTMNGPITEHANWELSPPPYRAAFDYDGDLGSDISVFRPTEGIWYFKNAPPYHFGVATDKVTPADYDADGKTDIAIFRPSEGTWYILRSSNSTVSILRFGLSEDIPVPADYNGDGYAEPAVFRPSTGAWYTWGGAYTLQFGQNGDVPVPFDYNGDSKSDVAVYRPTDNIWYIVSSYDGGYSGVHFGLAGDIAIPAMGIAVYRPSTGYWYIRNSENSFTAYAFGSPADVPVAADYDGDRVVDYAVFRPSEGKWYIANSSNGSFTEVQFGQPGDIPTQSAFIQR